MKTREIRLASRPEGLPTAAAFTLAEAELAPLADGEVRVRNAWMSVDPYMRGRMIDRPSYVPPFQIGHALEGGAIGEVIESRAEAMPVGTRVSSNFGWRDVAQGKAGAFEPLPHIAGVADEKYLGVLGMPGLTAWAGLSEVGQMKEGDQVFVSGAAGAVGSLACQLAVQANCHVVGSAGGAVKCEWLRGLGVHAVDYKAGDLLGQVKAAAPKGIDVYFDNVGGEHLEVAIALARPFARLIECGMIAQYNDARPPAGPPNMPLVIGKRLRIQGFIVFDFAHKRAEFLADVGPKVAAGKIVAEETVVDGLERAPEAFIGLFSGANTGKMLVRL